MFSVKYSSSKSGTHSKDAKVSSKLLDFFKKKASVLTSDETTEVELIKSTESYFTVTEKCFRLAAGSC